VAVLIGFVMWPVLAFAWDQRRPFTPAPERVGKALAIAAGGVVIVQVLVFLA
jgi:hypothetical protein